MLFFTLQMTIVHISNHGVDDHQHNISKYITVSYTNKSSNQLSVNGHFIQNH